MTLATENALVAANHEPTQSAHLTLLDRGATLEQIQQFMDLQDRHEAREARKAFVAAMAAFKAENIHIVKDKENMAYKNAVTGKGSAYVSLGNLVSTVTPFLSKHGLSVRWDIDQTNGIKVTGIVTHSMGHSESVSMTCPPDKSGNKNPIQEIKSAITYAKACTFESICGLASTDANVDDDGNGAAPQPTATGMADEIVVERLDWISEARNEEELKRIYLTALGMAKEAKDKKAEAAFIKATNKRKAELNASR